MSTEQIVMKHFELHRNEDETGTSGTGVVAAGVMWPDGHCVLRWLTKVTSTTHFAKPSDIEAIHGHGGKTRLVWTDEKAISKEASPQPPELRVGEVNEDGDTVIKVFTAEGRVHKEGEASLYDPKFYGDGLTEADALASAKLHGMKAADAAIGWNEPYEHVTVTISMDGQVRETFTVSKPTCFMHPKLGIRRLREADF